MEALHPRPHRPGIGRAPGPTSHSAGAAEHEEVPLGEAFHAELADLIGLFSGYDPTERITQNARPG